MKKKYNETARQAVHIIVTITIAILFALNLIDWYHMLIITLLGFLFTYLYKKYDMGILFKDMIQVLERPQVRKIWPGKGATLLALGIMLTMLIFPRKVVGPALMILALADGIPPLVTQRWHKYRFFFNKKKHWEGILSGWITASIGAATMIWWAWALIAAGITSFVESLDLHIGKYKLEDNILVPLLAGLMLTLMI